ncbi:cobaltochelatase subunit CobN [uncultured Candidatus Puniceispirillum sp.]|uniref:cobaltochelatase subunit CobN n=1 Tax=uncultured Candidatus Puniceispirillum sp. TaxID=1985115 RepID=UPI0032B16EDE
MHLLKIDESGALYDSEEAVDLAQPPGDIIILSSADTEVSLLTAAATSLKHKNADIGDIRIANYLSLTHPYSVDLYIEKTATKARIVVVRLLGGASYWTYGTQQLRQLAQATDTKVIFISGDGKPDAELDYLSSVDASVCADLAGYLDGGGLMNAEAFFLRLHDIADNTNNAPPARPLLRAGLYWPHDDLPDFATIQSHWQDKTRPVAALVFYRALVQAGDLAPIDGLIDACIAAGMNPLPIFASSLKEAQTAGIVAECLRSAKADVILNMTSFAVSDPSAVDKARPGEQNMRSAGPFGVVDAPVFQVVLASNRVSDWQDNSAGLTARDLAMNVALPELDGRILSRAIAFKKPLSKDPVTHAMTTHYVLVPERVKFVATLAAKWCALRYIKPADKKIALILANYPNKDGRIANGVGLDTPESAFQALRDLQVAGYTITDLPDSSAKLISALRAGPTNAGWQGRQSFVTLAHDDYVHAFASLPDDVRIAVTERWGAPDNDPMFDGTVFRIPVLTFGNAVVGVQPARGYNIDPKATYHAPDLVPPHNYFAFYIWLREIWGMDAVIHFGKHGNLEWLPGKALALSSSCYPEAVLGAVPHLYPFIVNDPGEGAQAKRRSAAVILDHLTPPMTNADSHGIMAAIESQMDEYYEAAGMDKARSAALLQDILIDAERAGLAKDCGILPDDDAGEKLLKLDNFLCDIKELQIRDGLHIFGRNAAHDLLNALLVQILRTPRNDGEGKHGSLIRALADDLGLSGDDDLFDPLTTERATPWLGAHPSILDNLLDTVWRSHGDTVERLDALALALVAGDIDPPGPASAMVLAHGLDSIRASLNACGHAEAESLQRGLAGQFVPAGASGAPTRGRPEVLPTGRNFFSIDSRALPTPVAWRLGWASANALLDRYLLDHGNWPKAMVLSAWGTSNMRTGGDDIAQALALMGVQPVWDNNSRRVTGFDIMPLAVLGRPRIDISLRCSGFFRDAFPAQMSLIDRAVQAVASLDEPDDQNPLAAAARAESEKLTANGVSQKEAIRQSTMRIFSAKPGAYGAGLQTLIDEGIWEQRADFAEAFLTWSSYAYGEQLSGVDARDALEARLASSDAVLHNQDNREHDILDSDDYYQFAGGLSAAVAHLSGRDVPIYHNDHSLPERPVIRSLAEEISRVVRGRASNPKWIAGAMRHGYKGAFEMLATVDYLFAFAATTRMVDEHHFTALYEAYIEDDLVRDFLETANDAAYDDMLARFEEAIARGLWTPRRNSVQAELEKRRRSLT